MNVASLARAIASFSWVVLIAVVVFVIFRSQRRNPLKNGTALIIVMVVISIILTSVGAGLFFVQPEERGVVISALAPKGYREEPLEPGLRWVIPFFENVVTYPISRQTYTMSIMPSEGQMFGDDSIEARTSDGQKVLVDASVIFQVDPEEVVNVHIRWQDRYATDLIRAQSRGVIRDAVSQFGVEEVYSTKRLELVNMITEEMEIKLEANGLILDDFVLRNISFSDEYAASVEQKQIAEQLAQQAKFVVEQRKQEAEQARQLAQGEADAAVIAAEGAAEARLIEANAEAEALGLIADALRNNPDLLTYQYLTTIGPEIDVMLLPSDAPFVFPLPEFETNGQVSGQTTIAP